MQWVAQTSPLPQCQDLEHNAGTSKVFLQILPHRAPRIVLARHQGHIFTAGRPIALSSKMRWQQVMTDGEKFKCPWLTARLDSGENEGYRVEFVDRGLASIDRLFKTVQNM